MFLLTIFAFIVHIDIVHLLKKIVTLIITFTRKIGKFLDKLIMKTNHMSLHFCCGTTEDFVIVVGAS